MTRYILTPTPNDMPRRSPSIVHTVTVLSTRTPLTQTFAQAVGHPTWEADQQYDRTEGHDWSLVTTEG